MTGKESFVLKNQHWKTSLSQRDEFRLLLPELLNKPKPTPKNVEKPAKHIKLSPNSSMVSLYAAFGQAAQDMNQPSPKKEASNLIFRRTLSQSLIPSVAHSSQNTPKKSLKKLLLRASFAESPKNEQPTEKIDKTIEIYNIMTALRESKSNYRDELVGILPSKSDLKKSLRALDLLYEEGNPNSDLMQLTVKIIKMATFCTNSLLQKYDSILTNIYSPDLHRVWKNNQGSGTPYYMMCYFLLEELKARDRLSTESKANYENKIAVLRQKIEDMNNYMASELKKMNEETLGRMKKDHEAQIEHLYEYIESQKNYNQKLNAMYEDETKESQALLKRLELESRQLQMANVRINDLQAQLLASEQRNENALKKLSSMREYSNNFKETLDAILIQLSGIRQMVNHIKTKASEAEAEKDAMRGKIDVGYADLTPRPDYKAIQLQNKVDLNIKTEGNKKEPEKVWLSTKAIVEALLNKYIELQKAKKLLEAEHEKPRPHSKELENRQSGRISEHTKESGGDRVSERKFSGPRSIKNVVNKNTVLNGLEAQDEHLETSRSRRNSGRRGSGFLKAQDLAEIAKLSQETSHKSKFQSLKKESQSNEHFETHTIEIDLAENTANKQTPTELDIISDNVLTDTQKIVEKIVDTKNIIDTITKNDF